MHRTARGFWVLYPFEDVFGATVDPETFSSAQGLTFEEDEIVALGLKPTLVMMDRPCTRPFRRLISRGFTPRKVAALEPSVRAFVRARWICWPRSESPTSSSSWPARSRPWWWPPTSASPRATGCSSTPGARPSCRPTPGWVVSGAADAVAGLYGYFTDLIEWRRSHPGDDMLSDLTAARVDGEPLALDEILGYCFVMIAGGNDTASGLLGGSAVALTEHPDQRPVLEDPGRLPGAVEELLRVTCPVQGLSRTTTREVAIRGVAIPEASKVHLLYGSANRDPREFGPTADELDLARAIRRMLTFGNGPHHCIGAAAARLQGRVALEELLAALPGFSVDVAGARLAPGPFVRRYESLPFDPGRRRPRTGRAPGDSPYP